MVLQRTGLVSAWQSAWSNAAFRHQISGTLPVLVLIVFLFSRFLEWVEARPGLVLADPVTAFLAPVDFTWPIFIIIYCGLIIGLVSLSAYPYKLLLALQAYILVVIIRFAMMYVTPLDPPTGIVPLADPFVQFFGSGAVPTRDLFFSGHTSTLLLLSFTVVNRLLKFLFAVAAITVGLLLIWQHVHYTVDVLVAGFVAYGVYRFASAFSLHARHPQV
jgi:hypothetical protein